MSCQLIRLRNSRRTLITPVDGLDPVKASRKLVPRVVHGESRRRPRYALAGRTPAEAYAAERPVDMLDKAIALPTSPQAQQQPGVINRILAA